MVGDVEDLSQFPDNHFDIYLSNLCLQLVKNQEKALAEAFRVLTPGGRIGFSVWSEREKAINLHMDALKAAGLGDIKENPRFIKDQ